MKNREGERRREEEEQGRSRVGAAVMPPGENERDVLNSFPKQKPFPR